MVKVRKSGRKGVKIMRNRETLNNVNNEEFCNIICDKLGDINLSYFPYSYLSAIPRKYIITDFIDWLNSEIQEEAEEKE